MLTPISSVGMIPTAEVSGDSGGKVVFTDIENLIVLNTRLSDTGNRWSNFSKDGNAVYQVTSGKIFHTLAFRIFSHANGDCNYGYGDTTLGGINSGSAPTNPIYLTSGTSGNGFLPVSAAKTHVYPFNYQIAASKYPFMHNTGGFSIWGTAYGYEI